MAAQAATEAAAAAAAYWTAGHPAIAAFEWESKPLGSSLRFPVLAVLVYLLGVGLLRVVVKRPVSLGPLPVLHNVVLLVASFGMFAGCLGAAVAELVEEEGRWSWLLCYPRGTRAKGSLFFWSYVYYLSKIYELLDTAIVVLRGKPLTFLHVFHHATVIFMCYFWLQYSQSLQVIALLTNTAVHVVMYSYYLLCSMGLRPPWKRLVTDIQIVQFLFSFVSSVGLVWLHFSAPAPAPGGCEGMYAWLFNAFFNLALLVLFRNFHRRQYVLKKKAI